MNFKEQLKDYQRLIENELEQNIKKEDCLEKILNESMAYSLLAGGKRLRPILTISTYKLFKQDYEKCMPFAIALEMVHNFSLIHDDLPGIDNDDFRHGKPTNHKRFNEATAILAGDALLNYGYIIISNELQKTNKDEMNKKIQVFQEFSKAVDRMIAGEYVDTEFEKRDITKENLDYIHRNKTGALLILAVRMGAILADAPKEELKKKKKIARELITKYPKSETIWLITIKKINDKIALEKSKKNDDNPTTTVTSSVDKKTTSVQKEGSKNETASPKEIKDDTKTKAVNKESSLSGKDSNSEPQVGKDTDTPQPAEKPKASLQKILEMSEEEFETYVKTLPNRETLFAVVARSKKQNQDKLAIGYIDMYLKKSENADETLAKQLKTMAKAKTPIFDEAKWDALAKRFNLDFNSGAKTLLRQMVELARQIDNYPFDLQIDKETLLAIQQLTKLNLSPDYPDEGQRIEIER